MTPSYPLVQEADQEVAEAKAAIAEAEKTPYINQETDRDPTFELLREDLAKTEADLAAQRANLAAVKRSIQSLQTQMVDLDQKSVTQQDLRARCEGERRQLSALSLQAGAGADIGRAR